MNSWDHGDVLIFRRWTSGVGGHALPVEGSNFSASLSEQTKAECDPLLNSTLNFGSAARAPAKASSAEERRL